MVIVEFLNIILKAGVSISFSCFQFKENIIFSLIRWICQPYGSLIIIYSSLHTDECSDRRTILAENGFSEKKRN